MSMYHVKSDGAMGVCKAQEGHCPFGGDAGVKHFTSATEAQAYAEHVIKNTTDGGMKKMTKNSNGLAVTTYPPSEHGCHEAVYSGWDGPDTIISAGGYVNGVYVPASEVWGLAGLYDRLSEDVRVEMPMPDGYPGDWNDKILELKKKGVSDEDEEILDALWVSGEVCEGSVTIYGRDDSVTRLDEDDLYEMGLTRVDSDDDDDDDDEDEESPTLPTTTNNEPQLTTNKWGLKVTTWPTERGVHSATYLGWRGSGASPHDDHVVSSGGWIDGEYIGSTDEIGLNRLWDRLPEDVRDELSDETYDPVEWNSKILELEKSGELSDEDEALLDAFWIEAEAFEGSVTIYGRDDDVSEMDEDDFRLLGLKRMDADELWSYGILVDDDDDDDEDEDE